LQFILRNIIARETTMVLRMTGAGWLATMMRAERDDGDRAPPEPAWLLDGAPDPEMIEALERLAAKDADRV
jgi:hypothetical protein